MKLRPTSCAALLLALAMLPGCSSLPSGNPALEQARDDYERAQADATVRRLAKDDLREAAAALDLANMAWAEHAEPAAIGWLAQLASRRVGTARATAARQTAEFACAAALPGSACPEGAPHR